MAEWRRRLHGVFVADATAAAAVVFVMVVALVMRVVAFDVFRRSDRATCGSFSRENICRYMYDDPFQLTATHLDYRQWKKEGERSGGRSRDI